MLYFLGGLMKYSLDTFIFFAPTVNSYRRFRKFLVLNENTSVIHGRKLPQPTQYITNKFIFGPLANELI